MGEKARAERHVDPVRGVAEQVVAQAAQDHLEDHQAEQADGQHVQGRHAAVNQDLVHHDLEEQRCRQREQLQEEGGQKHFAEQAAVALHGGKEPGEPEAPVRLVARRPLLQQDQAPGPVGRERLQARGLRPCQGRVLHQDLAVATGSQYDETPIGRLGDRRERHSSKPADAGRDHPGVESERARRFGDELGLVRGIFAGAGMTGRPRVGRNPVEPRNDAQTGLTRFHRVDFAGSGHHSPFPGSIRETAPRRGYFDRPWPARLWG